jgi:hypothetical protein
LGSFESINKELLYQQLVESKDSIIDAKNEIIAELRVKYEHELIAKHTYYLFVS